MSTRSEILALLKTSGAMSSQDLSKRLGITPMAVKLQLYDLESEGVVCAEPGPRSRGRPSKLWKLTEAADEFFPNSHAALSRDILVGIRKTLGAKALDQVLEARAAEQYERYANELRSCTTLAAKVERLAHLRSEDGYMACVETIDSTITLVENHCPICSAAKECVKLCSGELELFQKALGSKVVVERTEHIVSGARRCVYIIQPRRNAGARSLSTRGVSVRKRS
jgi:predicted ArsR family transcriptional regulator